MRRRRTDGSLATGAGSHGPPSRAAIAAEIARVLSVEPAGILTDLDGTLAPIVERPDAARPAPGAVTALAALAPRLAVVGVVTGRAALDARRILGEEGRALLVVGNHGVEWLWPGADAPAAPAAIAQRTGLIHQALGALPDLPGVVVEDKGLSATVHYRLAADPGSAREAILGAFARIPAAELELREGRRSVEVRLAGVGDKGSAVRQVATRYRLKGLLVAGDDVTDLDLFAAARAVGADGGRVAVIAVAGGREVPEAVAAAADLVLSGPEAFADLLRDLAEQLG